MRVLLLALAGCVAPPTAPNPPPALVAMDAEEHVVGGLFIDGEREVLHLEPTEGPRIHVEQTPDAALRVVGESWARGTLDGGQLVLARGLARTAVDLALPADAARSPAGGLVAPSAWRRAAEGLSPDSPTTVPVLDLVGGRLADWTVEIREGVEVAGEPAWRVYAASAGSGHSAFLRPDGTLLGVDGVAGGLRLEAPGVSLPWPATPPPPAGVTERGVAVAVDDADLAGTLATLGGGPRPLVMLHVGSGPIDRDGLGPGFGWGGYRDLAWMLAADGYAVLRVDKRGVGESRAREPDEELEHTAEALLGDATAWLDAAAEWPGVDRGCAVFVGHSEGGSLAPFVAQRRDLAGVVMLAGPHDDLHVVLREQLEPVLRASGLRDDEIAAARRAQEATLLALEHAADDLPGPLQGGGTDWLRSHAGLEPGPAAADLDIPVLALFGEHDVQVLPSQGDRLAAALADRPDARVTLVPGVDHLLGVSPVPGMGHYADPDRGLAPGITDPLRAFLAETCPPPEP